MPKYVIDTNVPIVANGDSSNVTIKCRLAAVKLLQKAINEGMIYIDNAGEIQSQYKRYLNSKGQPGVGDRFYLEVINSNPGKVTRVEVEKDNDGQYINLPKKILESTFDQSDRVFAAVARKVKAKVCNAVDADWVEHRENLEQSGIPIIFICGADPATWREKPAAE